jgi:hypothetical protein
VHKAAKACGVVLMTVEKTVKQGNVRKITAVTKIRMRKMER